MFEIREKPSQKVNNGTITEKISERTDRIEHTLTFGEIYNKLQTLKKIQTIVFSKYQVFNDHIHCPKILSTFNSIGRIYHMDCPIYSRGLFYCHFRKSQYLLHYAVKHKGCDSSPYE